jgi:hypothetical protein
LRAAGATVMLAATVVGCRAAPPPRGENPLEAPPVDRARVGSAELAAAWAYRKEVSADLDGDGSPERVVIAADVVVSPRGLPLWEDGHRWAVYAESSTGERTLLYAAFVPQGFAEAAVTVADAQARRHVLVQERTRDQLRALEVEYAGPGRARSRSAAYYQIGEWLPGSASLR